jgi:hypothetical protein
MVNVKTILCIVTVAYMQTIVFCFNLLTAYLTLASLARAIQNRSKYFSNKEKTY